MLRKTARKARTASPAPAASMRPQRNAAENLGEFSLSLADDRASMRPQRNAAENIVVMYGSVQIIGTLQ